MHAFHLIMNALKLARDVERESAIINSDGTGRESRREGGLDLFIEVQGPPLPEVFANYFDGFYGIEYDDIILTGTGYVPRKEKGRRGGGDSV